MPDRVGCMLGILLSVLLLSGCEDQRQPRIATPLPLPPAPPSSPFSAEVDPLLPGYEPSGAPRLGRLRVVADEATFELAKTWASALSTEQASLQVEASLPAETPEPWWSRRRAPTVALLSREMPRSAREAFEAEWGHAPLRLTVAMNPAVVIVHADNPITAQGLALEQLDAIFARRPRKSPGPLQRWGALIESSEWTERHIRAFGVDSRNPLWHGFRQRVLHGGEFRSDLVQFAGARSVAEAVGRDSFGIGFTTFDALDDSVAPLPLTASDEPARLPTSEALQDESYPLPPGYLYLYVNRRPAVALSAQQRELIRFIYSRQGQRAVQELGRLPVDALQAAEELHRSGIRLVPDDVVFASSNAEWRSARSVSISSTTSGASHSRAP